MDDTKSNNKNIIKQNVLWLAVGVLIGAVIAVLSVFVYAKNTTITVENSTEMPQQGQMPDGNPPEKPDGQGQPDEQGQPDDLDVL